MERYSEEDEQIIKACSDVEDLTLSGVVALVERIGSGRWEGFLYRVIQLQIRVPAILKLKLVKLRTIQEISSRGVNSATLVPSLIKRLRESSPELAYEMEVWAFHSTTNYYVPFGIWNRCREDAISVAEYHRLIGQRDAKNLAIENRKQEIARHMQAERANKHKQRLAAQHDRNCERNKIIQRLNEETDPLQRLLYISLQSEQPAPYFPEKFADISDSLLTELGREAADLLLKKLRFAPRGKWRNLRRKLLQIR